MHDTSRQQGNLARRQPNTLFESTRMTFFKWIFVSSCHSSFVRGRILSTNYLINHPLTFLDLSFSSIVKFHKHIAVYQRFSGCVYDFTISLYKQFLGSVVLFGRIIQFKAQWIDLEVEPNYKGDNWGVWWRVWFAISIKLRVRQINSNQPFHISRGGRIAWCWVHLPVTHKSSGRSVL